MPAGGGFAGAVDADEEGDFGAGLGGPGIGRMRGFEDGAEFLLEQGAEFFAAFDGLAAGAVAQGVEDGGGGLDAEVAG